MKSFGTQTYLKRHTLSETQSYEEARVYSADIKKW